jgi:predicted acylesterase/phospholipase RssA
MEPKTTYSKIGLTLVGGGAKGAYQIGVWKALREKGIQIDAIAGTSIGAFNAALILSNDWDRAQRFWLSLSTLRVAKLNRLFFLSIVLNFLHLIFNRRYFYTHIPPSVIKSNARFGISTALFLLLFFVYECIYKNKSLNETYYLLLLALGVFSFNTARYLADTYNISIVRPDSLKFLVENGIDWDAVKNSTLPTFITVVRECETYYLPELIHITRASDETLKAAGYSDEKIREVRKLKAEADGVVPAPFYIKLNDLPIETAKATVMGSMALPVGIVGRIKIDDDSYMDGGILDNTPMYPLLSIGCDKVYVVHLNPRPREGGFKMNDPHKIHLKMLWIDYTLAQIGFPRFYRNRLNARLQEYVKSQMREGIAPSEEIKHKIIGELPATVTHITPSKSLGFSMFGTLFFSPRKTEKLIELGYQDALKVIEAERQNSALSKSYS